MPVRIVVHAGFHKTGTSSVQHMLRANKRPLARALRVFLKPDMTELCEAARAFSATPEDLERALVHYEASRLFGALDPEDARTVLLSSEDLSGHIPGRQDRMGYPAAPLIMKTLADAARATLGPKTDISFYFSTRAPAAWMKSCYAQHVRATRMTMTLEAYEDWQRPAAGLLDAVDAVAEAVEPSRVYSAALEDVAGGPMGPLDPILDILRLKPRLRDRLTAQPPSNTAMPPEVLDALLALNRSDLARPDMRARKEALITAVRKG